jgi:HK97 family phage major capsid protein
MNKVAELQRQRIAIVNQMVELSEGGLKTPEERSKFDGLKKDQNDINEQIKRLEDAALLHGEITRTAPPPNAQPNGGQPEDPTREKREMNAFMKYLRYGRVGMTDSEMSLLRRSYETVPTSVLQHADPSDRGERRDMGEAGLATGVATGAGVTVPVGFVQKIETAMKYVGPFLFGDRRGPTIMPTSTGQSLPYPTENDTSIVGELVGEGQQVSTQDITLGQIIFGAWKYSSKMVRVSMELLQDSAFSLDDYIAMAFAIRLTRILNQHFTTGTGSNQPNGLITAATLATGAWNSMPGVGSGTGIAVGSVANDGVGGFNTIGSDDLVNLEHSVDPLYRRNASFMMHDSTLAALKRLKDKYGRPLWMTNLESGLPFDGSNGVLSGSMLGYPVFINNNMDQLQTQSSSPTVTRKTVAFGDLTKYVVRQVKEMAILRLTERFADFGQIAFIAFGRYDGQLLDAGTHPVQYLENVG